MGSSQYLPGAKFDVVVSHPVSDADDSDQQSSAGIDITSGVVILLNGKSHESMDVPMTNKTDRTLNHFDLSK